MKTLEGLQALIPDLIQALNDELPSCGFPVYTSLDVRDAGFKAAVVDVNLFPAGFNNLTPKDHARGAMRMRDFFSSKLFMPPPWNICVVPEAHTSNQGYLENLSGILKLVENAGCNPRLLWPGEPIPKPWVLKTASGQVLEYLPAEQALEGAHALLLNHDLSGGIPKAIQNVPLPTFPSTRLGWYRRKKTTHFEIVQSLLSRLQSRFPEFDPWCFSLHSRRILNVDFDKELGLQESAEAAREILVNLRQEYKERGLRLEPQIFVKNNSGTYGMGVVSIKDPSELLDGGRKLRNKMRKGKESVPIRELIIQEAVPTALVFEESGRHVAAEPVLYLIHGVPIGGFLRLHEDLGPNAAFENLNQPGSKLEPLDCSDRSSGTPSRPYPLVRGRRACEQIAPRDTYGFLATLHAVAAGLEDCPNEPIKS